MPKNCSRAKRLFLILALAPVFAAAFADPFGEALDEGISLFQSGEYEAAIACFEEAAKSKDGKTAVEAQRNIGICRLALEDPGSAIAPFERALGIDKDDLPSLEGLSLACFGDKATYEKGFRYASRAAELFSGRAEVYYNLACYHGYKGDAAAALKRADEAIYHGYDDIDFLSADPDLASLRGAEPFASFLRNLPPLRKALSLRAKAEELIGVGLYEEASRLCLQAIDQCRIALGGGSLTEADLLSTVGVGYMNLKRYPQARDAFAAAAAMQAKRRGAPHPEQALCLVYAGNAQYGMAAYGEALSSYLEALAIQAKALGEDSSALIGTHRLIAAAYGATGKKAQAEDSLRKALALMDPDSPGAAAEKAALEIGLGQLYASRSSFEEAETAYRNALAAQEESLGPEHPEVANTCAWLGSILLSLGRFSEARSFFERSLAIGLKVHGANAAETIAASEGLGDVLYAQSEFAQALARYESDLSLIKRSSGESSVQAAQCYQRLASTQYSLGQYEKSIELYGKAKSIWAGALGAEHPEVARCLLGIAASHYTRGFYDEAIEAYAQALEMQSKANGEENVDVAKGYLGLGLSYYSKGEFTKAVPYYERAAAIQKRILGDSSPDLSRSYLNLSAAYSAMGDDGNAIAYIDKCLSIQERIFGKNHLDTSVSYKMAGNIYFSLGEYSTAIKFYRTALDIQTMVLGGEHQQVAETKNNLGAAYESWGSYGKAIESYREALSIKERVFGKGSPLLALDYLNLGSASKKAGDDAKALEFLLKAQSIAQKGSDRRIAVSVAESLGKLYFDLRKYKEARKALQGGIAIVERARTAAGSGGNEIMAQEQGLYYSAIEASAAMGDLGYAFQAAESMKARGYLDRLSLAAALGAAGVPAKDRGRMLELGERIEKLAYWRMEETGKPEEVQDKKTLLSVAGELQDLESEYGKLDRTLMAIPRYRDLRSPAIATLKETQKALGPGQAFLDYILCPRGPAYFARCMVVTRDSARLIDLDASFDYAMAVFEWRDAIIGKKKEGAALGEKLYDVLIRPLEGELAGIKRLIIVPDANLALLPFDALRKDGGSPYLCQNFEISLAPSVSTLLMTDGRDYGKRQGEWLGLGGVVYGDGASSVGAGNNNNKNSGRGISVSDAETEKTKAYYAARGEEAYFEAREFRWARLPGAKREVEDIAGQVFGGKGVSLLLGNGASETAIKKLSGSGELARQRIVHFACHAFFDGDYPQYSALVLAEAGGAGRGNSPETGYLTVEDIALLDFKADLVALSACETGRGIGLVGDGLIGFARSLLVAGANRAQVTLWPIDDAATLDFMVRWYGLIRTGGLGFAEALTRVKREFLQSGPYSDPAYWSGFVLYGR